MKNLGLLILLAFMAFNASCGKQETSAANTNSNAVNPAKNGNSNQTSEQVSAPKGLKPSEPCGWLETSLALDIKTKEYKESSYTPGRYDCDQAVVLVNGSQFNYSASGDATTIKQLYVAVSIRPSNTAKQKDALMALLFDAANQVAEKAGGQKLTDEMLMSIIAYERKEFTLAPGEDTTKPQIKSIITNEYKDNDTYSKTKDSNRSVMIKF